MATQGGHGSTPLPDRFGHASFCARAVFAVNSQEKSLQGGRTLSLNWKRGLTRSYLVLWAAWMVFIVARAVSIFHANYAAAELTAIFLTGVLAPAVLFLALRWVFHGFHAPGRD